MDFVIFINDRVRDIQTLYVLFIDFLIYQLIYSDLQYEACMIEFKNTLDIHQ